MKGILIILTIIVNCNLFAQLNLSGLLNKKENNSNTPGSAEILFSNKINADGSKTGIEFKNELPINDDIFLSVYLNKELNKIVKTTNFSLDVEFYVDDAQVRTGKFNYVGFSNIIQYGFSFKKEFLPYKAYDIIDPSYAKQWHAPIFNYINNLNNDKCKLTVKIKFKDQLIGEGNCIIDKKLGKYSYKYSFEKDISEKNTNEFDKKRFLNLFKSQSIVIEDKKQYWNAIEYQPSDYEIIGVKIYENDWGVVRDKYTGAILYRNIYCAFKLRNKKNNFCFYTCKEFRETFDGKTYLPNSLSIFPSYDYMCIYIDCE